MLLTTFLFTILFSSVYCVISISIKKDVGIDDLPGLYLLIFYFHLILISACVYCVVDLSDNKTENFEFQKEYAKVEYLIKTYNINFDENGDCLLDIKKKVFYINQKIEKYKKKVNNPLCKEFYAKEIAEAEPINFDFNNLIKVNNNE